MSIGILNMKLHLKIVDGHRFRIRKVSGGPTAIVASDGRDVDIDFNTDMEDTNSITKTSV